MTDLLTGEMFAGVGGLSMGVNRVFGSKPGYFCEIDDAPSKVLAHRFPDVPNYGDVTRVDFTKVKHTHIRCGGFPCQDVSLGGRRAGMKDGTRSGLWSEFARSIAEDRPDWVVIENVRGLLSADATGGNLEPCPWCVGDESGEHALRALGAVLADLAELGFDAEWVSVRASDVGAPHQRVRVFILAWPRERTTSDAGRGGSRRGSAGSEQGGRDDAALGSDPRGDGRRADHSLTLLPTPAAGTPNDGESAEQWQERHDLHAGKAENATRSGMPLSIAVQLLPTPIVSDAESAARHTTTADASHSGTTLTDAVRLLPTPEAKLADSGPDYARMNREGSGGDDLTTTIFKQGLHLLPTPNVAMADGGQTSRSGDRKGELLLGGIAAEVATNWGPYAEAIAFWEEISGRPAPAPVLYDGRGGKARLSAVFVEWLMGWPEGWVTAPEIGLTRREQLKACGNGVVDRQAEFALLELLSRPGVPTIEWPVAA